MKKTKIVCLLLVIALLVAVPVIASATEEQIIASGVHSAGLKWEVTESGTLTLSGFLDFRSTGGKTYPWEAYSDTITRVVVAEGLDRIQWNFFDELPNLSEVQLPSTVTEIPVNAFAYKTELRSFTVHKEVTTIGDYAFAGCTALENIYFEQGSTLESIGNYAFRDSILKIVEIPGSVKTLGNGIFQDCLKLTSVTLCDGLQTIGKEAFRGCNAMRTLNIPRTVESVGSNAVLYCGALENLRIDAPVMVGPLEWCENLRTVTLGEAVTYLPANMFRDCKNLQTIIAEAEITAVGEYAFYNTALSSFPFTDSLTRIEPYAFANTALTEVTIPESIVEISNYAFANCDSLRSVDMGVGVERICCMAFGHCVNLTQMNLRHVKELEFEAFYGCTALKDVTWSDRLETVGYHAFKDCTSLEEVVLPATLQYLEHSVFHNCTGLKRVYFQGDAPTMGGYNFYNATATVYYPANNDTWTEDIWRENGGTLTLVAYEPEIGNVQCGDKLQWKVMSGDTLVITGTGDMYAFANDADRPWHSVAESIKKIEIEYGVTSISAGAFSGFTALESITFVGQAPAVQEGKAVFDGVTAIAYYPAVSEGWTEEKRAAFGGNMTWTTHDNVVGQGSCGENLTWTFTTDNVLRIAGTGQMQKYYSYERPWAAYIEQIERVVISEGVTSVSDGALRDAIALVQVELPGSLRTIEAEVFAGCEALVQIRIPEGVTSIGNMVFQSCSSLEKVELPASLLSIGGHAFESCRALTDLELPENLTELGTYAFNSCRGLKQITIPQGVTTLPDSLFSRCRSLETIHVLGNVQKLGDNCFFTNAEQMEIYFYGDMPQEIHGRAFSGVSGTCYYPAGNDTWIPSVMESYSSVITWKPFGESTEVVIASGQCGENVFWSVNDKGTLRIFGSGAMTDYWEDDAPWFDYMDQIQLLVVESGVTHVGAYAFYGCPALERVVLDKGIMSIGEGAFAYSSVPATTLPESLVSIADGAFACCLELTEIAIPKNVTEFSANAFLGCSNLKWIGVDRDNPVYSSDWGIVYSKDKTVLILCPEGYDDSVHCADACLVIMPGAFYGCTKITSVQLHGVRQMGEGVFAGCTALEYVSFGYYLDTIPANTFAMCEKLTTLEDMETISHIEAKAFYGCAGLQSITFPSGLISIGPEAFGNCSGLKKIFFTGQVPTIDDTAFTGVTAEATYPRDKQTWTSDALKNYGGKLTWKKEPEPVVTQVAGGKCSAKVSWKLYDNGKLVISGSGAIPNYTKNEGAPWLEYAEEIKELMVEQGVTGLGDWNFVAPNMITVQLPASLKTISGSAFVDCRKLTGVHVTKDNKTYASQSGVLYNKAMTELIWCPNGFCGELTIASTTKTIRESAFQYCHGITSVVIPASVTSIGDYAFMGCVGTLIFNGGNHSGLMNVYFEGDAPEFGQDVFYGMMATIHYPAANSTWTEAVRQNYGGKRITWQPNKQAVPGDINGDGKVNNKDASCLFQYLSGWDVAVDEARLDINADGKVNNKDASCLFQYLSGWDVQIF